MEIWLVIFSVEHGANRFYFALVDSIVRSGIFGLTWRNQFLRDEFIEDFLHLPGFAFNLLFQQPPRNNSFERVLRPRVGRKISQYVPSDLTLVSCTHIHEHAG